MYAWLERGAVVYVGATGLAPATRTWLHVHDPDPEVGRMAARFERLAEAELDVLAMRVPDEVSRADIRDAVGARLEEEGLLAPGAIIDHRCRSWSLRPRVSSSQTASCPRPDVRGAAGRAASLASRG